MKGWQQVDHRLTATLFRAGIYLREVWVFWSLFGFLFLAGLTGYAVWRERASFWVPLFAAAVTLFVFLVTVILQQILKRHRPTEELHGEYHAMALKWSFPSAHASTAFAWATVSVMMLSHAGGATLPLCFVFGASAFLVSISRVFLGVHHLFDVLAGALLGILVSIIVMEL